MPEWMKSWARTAHSRSPAGASAGRFLRKCTPAALALLLAGCGSSTDPDDAPGADGRLEVRAGQGVQALEPGIHPLGLGATERDGALYLPSAASDGEPLPLLLLLHGFSGSWQDMQGFFSMAEELDMVLLVPDSRFATWDRVGGPFGADVAFIDRALEFAFEHTAVDPGRMGIGGFSDGASYGLSLGLTNGDLFTHVLAFSPGFAAPASLHGLPEIFIAHGSEDMVLPVGPVRDDLVPALIEQGYSVIFREFPGGHMISGEVAREAMEWLRDG